MSYISNKDRIYVAGHNGLVGGAIVKALTEKGHSNLITRSRSELDLLDVQAVRVFFKKEKPDVVFLAAAKVGGIHANNTFRADFIYENIQVQNNVIWNAHLNGVKRLVFLGSSCIYPRNAEQPIRENALLTGHLEYTNRPYALAKIAGLELVNALRMQHGRDYFSVMPTNLYGPRDNFHPENSHVLPALVRRFCEAKDANAEKVIIWGTGTPKREFLYAEDCADAIVFLAENLDTKIFKDSIFENEGWSHINIGSGQELSIAELANLISDTVGFKGKIEFDKTKPDGMFRKLLDTTQLKSLGWEPKTSLRSGISATVDWFLNHY
ncbi:MAG: GDP-L-fucose synthase [Oligoflexales bacterium]|nr:GDP-L-fucose synthase [Oligoflexales bacterium]